MSNSYYWRDERLIIKTPGKMDYFRVDVWNSCGKSIYWDGKNCSLLWIIVMPTGAVLDVIEVWRHNKVVKVSCRSCESQGDNFSLAGEMQLINKIKNVTT